MTTAASAPAARRHRGFDLTLCVGERGLFAFEVAHLGLSLHASEAAYRSPAAAACAARTFVNDALAAFDADPAPAA